jgi:predicted cupin superfamily sugar epimerase
LNIKRTDPGRRWSKHEVIERLSLAPLPGEGGFYREPYRSTIRIPEAALPDAYQGTGARDASTSIYYLLTDDTYSALHRIRTDELYHFYAGDPVELTLLDPAGDLRVVTLGNELHAGHTCFFVVPAGVWQGLRLVSGGEWGLMGVTVAPGFEFVDRTMADRSLLQTFPDHRHALEPLFAHSA